MAFKIPFTDCLVWSSEYTNLPWYQFCFNIWFVLSGVGFVVSFGLDPLFFIARQQYEIPNYDSRGFSLYHDMNPKIVWWKSI